jgi:N-acyl-D-amino-acid deacylase
MFDLIISGGVVVDGTGADPVRADVAVSDGRIVAVGSDLEGEAAEVIDASGRVVTPGFVDIHTHYDGQITWDGLLEPSTNHGVTTVMVGNCGVGFAPVRADGHERLIELMEGVEDIPGAALAEGISWGWESFPEYLDVLEQREWAVDVGTQLPHGALRAYVMDDPTQPHASGEAIEAMARLARGAAEAGAFGFTTSRTMGHRSLDGQPVPGTFALDDELRAIGNAFAAGGGRLFEVAGSGLARSDDPEVTRGEVEWIGALAQETGLATTFILLECHDAPDRWRAQMDEAAAWRAKGATVHPLVAARPFGVLYGWEIRHPFTARVAYREVATLPIEERLVALGDLDVRAAILDGADDPADGAEAGQLKYLSRILAECYVLEGRPDYEQPEDRTLGQMAEQQGLSLEEVAYDALLDPDAFLMYPLYNYAAHDHQSLYEQLLDPDAVVGLNDGGAHVAFICDASIPTYLLTHWVRDRARGPRITLTDAVRRLTSQPAELYGLDDRGRIEVGSRADLNVIDTEGLRLELPRAVHDLPAGGTRLLQEAVGYDATIVGGVVTRRHGVDTGARPGRLLRRG